jgi:transcription initiation factor TFIIA large subunit
MHVAQCPWDPAPAPQITNPPTLPSNVKSDQSISSLPPQQPRNVGVSGEQHIKQEIKYEGGSGVQSYPQASAYGGSADPSAAQARTNQLLQQRFGNQAQASIHATGLQPQQQQRAPQMQGRPTHIQLPGTNQHIPSPSQQRPTQPPQQQQYPPPHNSLSTAQTDGADDGLNEWTAILADRRARTAQDRLAADGMLRAHLEQSAARMDSGLMMPLSEIPSLKTKKRHALSTDASTVPGLLQSPTAHIPQMDGGDDDDDDKGAVKTKIEADEDAINSDLDDSDDDLENPDVEEQDGPLGETILCTYDKVQRVKNKVSLLFYLPRFCKTPANRGPKVEVHIERRHSYYWKQGIRLP